MKSGLVVACGMYLAGCVSAAAEAGLSGLYNGTVWADGVSLDSGWYDIDKSATDTLDDMLCYAASATNLITWWQFGEYGRQLTSSAPTDPSDVWNTFLVNCTNPASGGDPLAAINWWISGVYVPMNDEESQRSLFNQVEDSSRNTLKSFPGYYFDQYGLNRDDLSECLTFTTEYTDSYFGDLLSGGAGVSLLLRSDTGALAHAITLWGVEYDNGELVKLWITDSDDGSYDLCSIDVLTNENGKVYFDADGDIGDYDLFQYIGITGIHIDGVSAIHPEATASWQLVPEPATATLSLLALTGLVMRRRRCM